MTIHLPKDVESSIEAAVHRGRFTSLDDAMVEAARLLLRELAEEDRQANPVDPILGLMRNDVELMDEIVADAYRHRREETWREADL